VAMPPAPTVTPLLLAWQHDGADVPDRLLPLVCAQLTLERAATVEAVRGQPGGELAQLLKRRGRGDLR